MPCRMEIEWYPGKSLTLNPSKGSKNAKPMTTTEICYSFFKFFKPPQYDDYIDEDMVSLVSFKIPRLLNSVNHDIRKSF